MTAFAPKSDEHEDQTAPIFEEAKKPAYKLTIDFGDFIGTKKTSAKITNYKLDELQEKSCIAVINLGNKQIGPFMSECLVLGVVEDDSVVLIKPDSKTENGLRIA